MQQTSYVGPFTAINLKSVAQGVSSIESLRKLKDLHRNCDRRHAELEISLNETLSVLDPLPNRTVKELIATMYEYQEMFSDIKHRPEGYSTEHLTPAIAQAWYANQILAIRSLLQKGGRA